MRAIELLKGYDILKTLEQNINLAKQVDDTVPEQGSQVSTDETQDESKVETNNTEILPIGPTIMPDNGKAPANEGTPSEE